MEKQVSRHSLLEEVERRQDEVIAQLDALNARVEAILAQWSQSELRAHPEPSELHGDPLAPSLNGLRNSARAA